MKYYNLISMMLKGAEIVYDADAQAFITATGISGTNANAINTLVIDLKAASIWTKMKAVYPMVGGTATAHKFNLKNPLDTDAAFRLVFSGGWTHSANGALPNGTDGYASSFLIPNTVFGGGFASIGVYVNQASTISGRTIGSTNMDIILGSGFVRGVNKAGTSTTASLQSPDNGFLVNSRIVSSGFFVMNRNRVFATPPAPVLAGPSYATTDLVLGATNSNGTIQSYSDGQIAFAYCSDGLTQNECLLLYQITEKYQVALSRSVYTAQSFYYNAAYNNETNIFLFSTQITDNTIQTATNTLVTDLKTAGVFTKMKAIYPMVGGTATTHKFNLVNAQDTDAAFRLSFIGGGTHSANGYQPNGLNAYADTFLNASTNVTINNTHISFYSRTNQADSNFEMGATFLSGVQQYLGMYLRTAANLFWSLCNVNQNNVSFTQSSNSDSRGFFIANRSLSTSLKGFKNSTKVLDNSTPSGNAISYNIFISAINSEGTAIGFSSRECAFASIGDGLTDAEALALYNAVNAFQVTLGRNV